MAVPTNPFRDQIHCGCTNQSVQRSDSLWLYQLVHSEVLFTVVVPSWPLGGLIHCGCISQSVHRSDSLWLYRQSIYENMIYKHNFKFIDFTYPMQETPLETDKKSFTLRNQIHRQQIPVKLLLWNLASIRERCFHLCSIETCFLTLLSKIGSWCNCRHCCFTSQNGS